MTPYNRLNEEIRNALFAYQKSNDISQIGFFYRGHANCAWKIIPSICRDAHEKLNESSIIEQQIKDGNWNVDRSLFDNIAHLQHYGVHTRFLDFTTDLDTAIYFACDDDKWSDTDGEIIICSYDLRNDEYIDTVLITELALLKKPISIADFVDNLIKKYPQICMNKNCWPSPHMALGQSVLSWIDHGFMVTPSAANYNSIKAWNQRMFNQKGAFFIPGNKTNPPYQKANSSNIASTFILPEIEDIPDTIRKNGKIMRVKISSADKRAILDELNKKGINKKHIYPD